MEQSGKCVVRSVKTEPKTVNYYAKSNIKSRMIVKVKSYILSFSVFAGPK